MCNGIMLKFVDSRNTTFDYLNCEYVPYKYKDFMIPRRVRNLSISFIAQVDCKCGVKVGFLTELRDELKYKFLTLENHPFAKFFIPKRTKFITLAYYRDISQYSESEDPSKIIEVDKSGDEADEEGSEEECDYESDDDFIVSDEDEDDDYDDDDEDYDSTDDDDADNDTHEECDVEEGEDKDFDVAEDECSST